MFDKLKRIFIVEEESGKKTSTKKSAVDHKGSNNPVVPKRVSNSSASSNVSGTPEEKFTNILFEAIEANDLEGFDYLEYKESLQSLGKMNMDEATQYKSAFAMAQTMGATPQKLVDSIQHYKNVLGKEHSKFGQALENQKTRQIDQEKSRISQLEEGIVARKKQLDEIKKQIEVDEKALEKARSGLDSAASKISATKANFIASYKMILDQLDTDLEKIKTYLK